MFGDQTGPSEASWSTGPAGGTGDKGRVVDQLTDRGWGGGSEGGGLTVSQLVGRSGGGRVEARTGKGRADV